MHLSVHRFACWVIFDSFCRLLIFHNHYFRKNGPNCFSRGVRPAGGGGEVGSGARSDNNHAHPDTSMKLGRNVH